LYSAELTHSTPVVDFVCVYSACADYKQHLFKFGKQAFQLVPRILNDS
jgi:hypothetical protein